jgi:predicted homoserine dehydrogenase-like protein
MNPKMFNSFIDGTKSAIEMTAVCNATGLLPQEEGLRFPPASCWDLANICRPKSAGGLLSRVGTTEVVSSLHRDQSPVDNDLQFGTYVIIEGGTEYARRCFREYRMLPDDSGQYAALFRPTHMIGLELGLSVASIALRGEPTGAPTGFRSDVAAVAKRDLKAGETLDGEGGYSVWGRQLPARRSVSEGALPIGLAHGVILVGDIAKGETVRWEDVEIDAEADVVRTRREMESTCL